MKIEKTSLKTKYSQNARIDLSDMEDMTYVGIKMKYSITLPAKIDADKTNGIVSEDGKTVTWNLQLGEINEITFEATSGDEIIWIICCSVIGALVIAIVVILIVKNKKQKETKKAENLVEEK